MASSSNPTITAYSMSVQGGEDRSIAAAATEPTPPPTPDGEDDEIWCGYCETYLKGSSQYELHKCGPQHQRKEKAGVWKEDPRRVQSDHRPAGHRDRAGAEHDAEGNVASMST